MLSLDPFLDLKSVKGQKIRAAFFYVWLPCPPAVLLFFVLGNIATAWQEVTLWLFLTLPLLLLLLIPLLCFKAVLCVLTDTKLFFTKADLTQSTPNTYCKKQHSACSGSIALSDIQEMKYFPAVRGSAPSHVMLMGTEFQLIIYEVGRGMMKRIKRKQALLPTTPHASAGIVTLPSAPAHVRQWIWQAIFEVCESGKLESHLADIAEITRLVLNEELDTVDITIQRNTRELALHIDAESLFLYAYDSGDISQSLSLSGIANLEDFFTVVETFVIKNT